MAKNNYKMNVNQYSNQAEQIRKAKGNPNKNIHAKKKNSNYGGYSAGSYMAQKIVDKANQQERVKLPTWLNVTLGVEFAAVLIVLILRLTAFKDSAMLGHAVLYPQVQAHQEEQRPVHRHHHRAGDHVPAVHHLRRAGTAGLSGINAPPFPIPK